jgi:hypothetical protein
MDNQEIIEKLYKLQLRLKDSNPALASAIERTNIPLLEYEKSLEESSEKDLLKIDGVGSAVARIIKRIVSGQHIYEIFIESKNLAENKKKKKKCIWS